MARPGTEDRPLRVAIVGAGPAGIYAADVLMKSDTPVSIDLYERQPAPFGLIRYGVAPDHPRIKGIVKALHQVLSKPEIRLLGNVEYGVDVKECSWRAQGRKAARCGWRSSAPGRPASTPPTC